MTLLTGSHKLILWITLTLATLGMCVTFGYEYSRGEVQSLTSTGDVTVTGNVPHIITIQVQPESRIPPTANNEVPLTVEIRAQNSVIPLTTIHTTTDANGFASLGTISSTLIPPGVYDVAIKGLSHLRKVYSAQSFDGPVVRSYTLVLPQLPAGDANPAADNYVNGLDISYLTLHIYSNDLRADLTHDGIINSLDYAALLRNIYSYGDN